MDLGDQAASAAAVVAYRPHVIIYGGDGTLVPAVERLWPAGDRRRPRWLASPLAHAPILRLAAERPELRKRMLGVGTREGTDVSTKFAMRYEAVFAPKSWDRSGGGPYDAFYVLAYAVAALGDQPITGEALARVIPRLVPPGEPIHVGPGGIYRALHALERGQNVDLDGTMTTLDFNLETGDATATFAVFCLTPRAAEAAEAGLVFDPRTRRLVGALRCP